MDTDDDRPSSAPRKQAPQDEAEQDKAEQDEAEQDEAVTRVARDVLHVRRAFGEPIVRDGLTVVPVARVTGGSAELKGSGRVDGAAPGERAQGERAQGEPARVERARVERARGAGSGSGGGGVFGVRVRPIGVYVINGSTVRWEPALDLGRAILGGQVVVAVVALAVAWARRRRR